MKDPLSTLSTFKNALVRGIGFGTGISIALVTTSLFAAAAAMKIFSPGEVISASDLNRNFMIAAPEGAVMAFDLANCPEGWTLADGTNGTHDLRGRFIRGLDKVGARAAGVDPDGATRRLGSEQPDAFQSHLHWRNVEAVPEHDMRSTSSGTYSFGLGCCHSMGLLQTGSAITDGIHGPVNPSSETRPRNVALIYCMRKN